MKPGGLLEAIMELSHERGLDQEAIIEAIEDAIVGAAYRKYKNYKNIEAVLNPQSGDVDLMHYKVVVEHVQDADNEILLDEVIQFDPLAECGDEVEYEIDAKEFKSVIAQTARQLIFQKIREAERESVIEKYQEKKGEIIHGTVSRTERGRVIITIGNSVEAALDYREQIPFEKLQPGENVRVLLIDLLSDGRGPQLIVSRTHPDFLVKLFEVEVPEVYDGIIEVVAAAREPGKRAKVAVFTNDPDIDPVGACVGMRGSRVQSIVSELCGERIDVIEWSERLEQFIANALAPAEIVEIDLDAENRSADIKIAQDQLSLAIGKQGQNVRLASKLTGIMININPWVSGIELGMADKDAAGEEKKAALADDTQAEKPGTTEDIAVPEEAGATTDRAVSEEGVIPADTAVLEEGVIPEASVQQDEVKVDLPQADSASVPVDGNLEPLPLSETDGDAVVPEVTPKGAGVQENTAVEQVDDAEPSVAEVKSEPKQDTDVA
ncbi:transcription termination factor NusA [bacterium]|nr:transcription termination factor NusA [bacterium]